MGARPNILLVDDREANLVALASLLEHHDATILTARSGVQALELLLVHEVALALLDVELPEMDGYEIAQLMRGAERTRDIPIIFVTAAGFERARVFKGYDVGAVDFLVKPLEPMFLDSKVRTFLRLHRQRLELADAKRRLEAMADLMPQLVWTAGPDGGIDYYNARASEYAGVRRMSDGSWCSQPVTHPDDTSSTLEAWRQALETRQPFACEHRIRMADEGYRWHLSRAIPVRDAATGVARWIGTATDIHEQKRVEDLLRENERRLGEALESAEEAVRGRDQLVSLVSHDLKNPLGAILMQAELLRRKLQGEGGAVSRTELEAGLARIERQASRMGALIAELLDVARLRAGRPLTLERVRTDLVALVRQVADEHQRLAPAHDIRVCVEVQALSGMWDRGRVERVFHNLLSNAVKYSPAGGPIRLAVGREHDVSGEWAVISVADEGVGIPDKDRARVFEWFARGENVESSTIRGTGIGLAGSRQIVEQHGGTISVESEQGRGSTFTVRLPLGPSEETAERASAEASAARPDHKQTNADASESGRKAALERAGARGNEQGK